MASRIFSWLRCLGNSRVDLTGSFQPNGAATTPLATTVKGNGATVTHTAGTGVFTVTLQDKYVDFDSADAWVMGPNPGIQAQITSTPDLLVNGTIVITVFDTSTKSPVVDPAFNANLWVCWQVRAKNTSGNF